VGTQLIAYGGRDDKLFRGAISESGAPTGLSPFVTAAEWQPNYDAIVQAANCSEASDTLACLRTVPTDSLSAIFNSSVTANATRRPVVDGDFLLASGTTEIEKGNFVKVPYLIGTNFDEGTAFGTQGINTTAEFIAMVMDDGPTTAEAEQMARLYPDDPALGIPATLVGRPTGDLAALGYQFKRSAAYGGDRSMHAGRRLTNEIWAKHGVPSYSYHFDVVVNGMPLYIGATHFQEVAFVFDNTAGNGYENAVAVDPFEGEPATFEELAKTMSRLWVSFVVHQNPNTAGVSTVNWPEYSLEDPRNIVFDVNVTDLAYVEQDVYRKEGIAYLQELFPDVYRY
jgi:cholinesterase